MNVRNTSMVDLHLSPVTVADWDTEDLLLGVLGDRTGEMSEEEKIRLLEGITLRLPRDIAPTELTGYRTGKATPISAEVTPDTADSRFYLIQVPVQIIIPDEKQRIVRLRLILAIRPEKYNDIPIVAYDLYPKTLTQENVTKLGEVSIDVAKALKFLPVGGSLGDCLGLELKFPLEWKTTNVLVQAAGLQDNPIEWLVTDTAIRNGFQGYAIIRAPGEARMDVNASIVFQLVRDGVLSSKKSSYTSDLHTYHIEPKASSGSESR